MPPQIEWEPHRPRSTRVRVIETSCCGLYEWCGEGGQYYVLRRTADGHEEAGRGLYREAREVWTALVSGLREAGLPRS